MAMVNKLEKIIDVLIVPSVITLAILIIGGLFFDLEKYEPLVTIADTAVAFVFVTDLVLKYRRVNSVKKFIRLYWLEILAVFPFYLLFRVLTFASDFGPASEILQKAFHESSLLKEGREIEAFAREERLAGRLLRVGQRSLRIIAARLVHAHKRLVKAHKEIKAS